MPYIGWREDERLDIEGYEAGWNLEGGLKYWFLDYLALTTAISYDKYSFDAQKTAIFKYQKYYEQDYTLKKFMAGVEYKFQIR